MNHIKRILDANANRAREAMRVMEDAARFVLNNKVLASSIKKLRHDFAITVKTIGSIELHRDTPGDVGATITTEAEKIRTSVNQVVIAAGKRLSEALRSLEEYGKIIDVTFASKIEKLRYQGYEIERQLHEQLGCDKKKQWKLCVLITEKLCTHHHWLDVVKWSIDGGSDCLQLREKQIDGGALLDRACQLVELVRLTKPKTAVIINDRPDIAMLSGADGVHLGQNDLPIKQVRKLVGSSMIIGISTHNLTEASRAIKSGADYCGVGAMFATATKQRKPSGLTFLKKFTIRYQEMPHLAIGGINSQNLNEVVAAGARGVAVSSCVCSAKKPATEVRKFVKQLR